MRGALRTIDIRLGDKVRKYGNDDWFHEGEVTDLDHEETYVEVDFGDWIQRYPRAAMREYWPQDGTYERSLISMVEGEMVEDYRMDA